MNSEVANMSTFSSLNFMPRDTALIRSGTLKLKAQLPNHAMTDKNEIEAYHWYIHLCGVNENTPAIGSPRMWIDAMCSQVEYYTTAHGPPNRRRFENLTITRIYRGRVWSARRECFYEVEGFIDCHNHSKFRTFVSRNLESDPPLSELQKLNINFLYVCGPKIDEYGTLEFNVPHTILEMEACARCLEKDIIRGVLTNGRQWVFLILRLNKEDLGGVYAHSDEFNLMDPISKEPSREAAKSLTYILTHWVHHAHDEIGTGDYYALRDVVRF